jgi:hypothetical protein
VSPTRGWAVGQDVILATADGGQRWSVQDRGRLNLTAVDFISPQVGWAVGTGSLLRTTDGGARWIPLPDPCVRSVHFVSASVGFAIAGGTNNSQFGLTAPEAGGTVLTTTDGGRSWRPVPGPKNPQVVCFNTSSQGWLGAAGMLYRTNDGGSSWIEATAGPGGFRAGYLPTMVVQCAGHGSAWALDIGPGAASSQQPHVGYRAGPGGVVPLFAEQYFPHPSVTVQTSSPGSYAGPVSAVSPSVAAFVDWCPACGQRGQGTAPWGLVTPAGVVAKGDVGHVSQPEAASFISAAVGWVVGVVIKPAGSGGRQYQTIVATDNGGLSWQIQYTGPPVRG